MEEFANGRPLRELPELYREAIKLRFIPCSERAAEAPHGIAYKAGHMKRNGPLTVLMALKAPEIEKEILPNREAWDSFCACAYEARQILKIPQMLGLQRHPWLQAHADRRKATEQKDYHKLVPMLSSIVTRCDDISQFKSHKAAQQKHGKMEKTMRKRASQYVPKKSTTVTLSKVLAHTATQHFHLIKGRQHILTADL